MLEREACQGEEVDELFHVFPSGVRKVLCISGTFVLAELVLHHFSGQLHWAGPVRPAALDRSRLHLLKANDHNAVCSTRTNKCSRHVESSRSSSAGVVGVVDWNARHAKLIEYTLGAGCVTL